MKIEKGQEPLNGKYLISLGFGENVPEDKCDAYLDRFLCRWWQRCIRVSRVGSYLEIGGRTYLELLIDTQSVDQQALKGMWTSVLGRFLKKDEFGVYPISGEEIAVFETLDDVSFFNGHAA